MSKKLSLDEFIKQQALNTDQEDYGQYQGYQSYGYQGYQGYGYQGYGYQGHQGNGYQGHPGNGTHELDAKKVLPRSGVSTLANTPNASSASLSSLGKEMEKLCVDTPIREHVVALQTATSAGAAQAEAQRIAQAVQEADAAETWGVGQVVRVLAKSKSATVRELCAVLVQQLALQYTGHTPQEAHVVPLIGPCLDLHADKDKNVVKAAESAAAAVYGCAPVEARGTVLVELVVGYLGSSAKWVSKVAAAGLLERIAEEVPADLLEAQFVRVVPALSDMATDFKPEAAAAGLRALKRFIRVLDNLDLHNKFDLLAETLADPRQVTRCVANISSVTFVAEVTEPALALLVPILDRLLKMLSLLNEQLRQTVAVTENLTRLVNDRREIERFIPVLRPGVEKVVRHAAVPEVRELAAKALAVLRDAEKETLGGRFAAAHAREALGLDGSAQSDYLAQLVAADVNVGDWARLAGLVGDAAAARLRGAVAAPRAANLAETEVVNADFSLAYGLRMLLNKTTLRLVRGHRYGLCGRNGAGKSTLMRAISKGQLEGFPPPSELRTCFVEHRLQGEEGDMDLVSFIALDPHLAADRAAIAAALQDVGFPAARVRQPVGLLSGGWKMKLELARAMLMRADVLLLDEPTNHLDVANVRWLEHYLQHHTDITSLIVLHDLAFLDAVCTDIIHYENKKLAYYTGNLSAFVAARPEGKLYYTLSDSQVKMQFPPPGILLGVKSHTRAIARLSGVSFAYPGAAAPSLQNVSCSLCLLSRVAILGPNGAGKLTLIKLLTGELVPASGTVEKHPNLRIGYIAQHALQHVEQHKEKTANQYLQWRYRFGDDREVLLKELRRILDDEKAAMEKLVDVGDGHGARQIEALVGRQKLKKLFQYEVKWRHYLPKYNSWVLREQLIADGFAKLVQRFDDHEALREGLGYRELTPSVIRKHFEDVGLDGDIADHTPMGSLSGGQLVKVVIAGAMWNNPHLLVLDEPTNYLDRDSLGGLAVAIRDWSGGVVMISHNNEFVGALCPEQWHVENGAVVQRGAVAVDAGRFEGLPAPDDSPANIKVRARKKKMTRNEKKAQAERRRLRHIEWLSSPKGTPKPPDSDEE